MGKHRFRRPGRPEWRSRRASVGEHASFDDHLETKMSIRRREEAFHLGLGEPRAFDRLGDGSRP